MIAIKCNIFSYYKLVIKDKCIPSILSNKPSMNIC